MMSLRKCLFVFVSGAVLLVAARANAAQEDGGCDATCWELARGDVCWVVDADCFAVAPPIVRAHHREPELVDQRTETCDACESPDREGPILITLSQETGYEICVQAGVGARFAPFACIAGAEFAADISGSWCRNTKQVSTRQVPLYCGPHSKKEATISTWLVHIELEVLTDYWIRARYQWRRNPDRGCWDPPRNPSFCEIYACDTVTSWGQASNELMSYQFRSVCCEGAGPDLPGPDGGDCEP